MPRGLRRRRQKTPVLVFCEGASEKGYVKFLNIMASSAGVLVNIIGQDLRGGSAEHLVARASQILEQNSRLRDIQHRYLLIDSDRLSDRQANFQQLQATARRNRIRIIFQVPCHEGFLLRHFDDFCTHDPPSSEIATRYLFAVWPNYRKGTSGELYAETLSSDHLATARRSFAELDEFLTAIGWANDLR